MRNSRIPDTTQHEHPLSLNPSDHMAKPSFPGQGCYLWTLLSVGFHSPLFSVRTSVCQICPQKLCAQNRGKGQTISHGAPSSGEIMGWCLTPVTESLNTPDSESAFSQPRVQSRPQGECCLTSELSYSSGSQVTLCTHLYYNLISDFLALLNYMVQENRGEEIDSVSERWPDRKASG